MLLLILRAPLLTLSVVGMLKDKRSLRLECRRMLKGGLIGIHKIMKGIERLVGQILFPSVEMSKMRRQL